jgi:hypothetical protein
MGGGGRGVFWRMLIATNGLEEVSLHNPVILPLETMLVQPDLLLISIFGDAHCTTTSAYRQMYEYIPTSNTGLFKC